VRTYRRIVVAPLVAALLFTAVAAETAAARRIELTSPLIRAVWETGMRINAPGVRCNVTLEGSFHEPFVISKVSGALIGYITRARVEHTGCTGDFWFLNGTEIAVQTLPWHIRYDSFEGSLPGITGIRLQIIGLSVYTRNGLNECLYSSTTARPAYARLTINTSLKIREINPVGSSIPLNTLISGLCEAQTGWEGVGSFTVLGGTAQIGVRLIV
jgi:hypothetical protein